MKAPSPLCLRALRTIAFPKPSSYQNISQRCYASAPSKPPPPPKQLKTSRSPPVSMPHPTSQPGYTLRQKRDDDDDFTPEPLTRPIGMPNPPRPGGNWGLDKRSLAQRRADFVDYDKHLEKRAKMTRQISKPYFRDWSNLRFHKGKVFVANERLFRAEHALFFPNFFGRTLRNGIERRDRKDGFGGRGRDTCDVMMGKVSVVSFVSNTWAVGQVDTFCGGEENPELQRALDAGKDVAQRVEINYEDNVLKWWLLRLFGLGGLRRRRSLEQQERYFIVRRGLSDIIKEAIGLLNDRGGYVYLVDQQCRIRWAGSAIAEDREKESMARGLKRLIQEARSIRSGRMDDFVEEEMVEEVVEADERRAAIA